MEDYDWELHGIEDDFHSQFAAELEVLAELEGGCGPRRSLVTCSSTGSWPASGSQGRRAKARGSSDQRRGLGGASEREGPSSAAECV